MGLVLPEWAGVQALPQRNAYHRFTVDRHLIETVAEAAALLDGPDVPVARRARVRSCCSSAHCSTTSPRVGRVTTRGRCDAVAGRRARLGLDGAGGGDLAWLVRDHLVMADTATRRDLADP